MGQLKRKPGWKPMSAITRVMLNVIEQSGPMDTDCWLSTYKPTTSGYAQIKVEGKKVYAHRIAYEHFIGPIPKGLALDHLCRTPLCVNPAHLEPVTIGENVARGNSPTAVSARTDICRRGHSLADAYMYRGCRSCRVCSNETARLSKQRLRAERLPR